MKIVALMIGLLVSMSSFADQISFTYFGNEGGRQSYYACDYVEDRTVTYLELFGATNIDVSCHGGITSWGVSPVSVRATYDAPVTTGTVESVEIKGDVFRPSCGVNVHIIRSLYKKFTNVEVVKKSDFCAFADSNYYYLLNVTR